MTLLFIDDDVEDLLLLAEVVKTIGKSFNVTMTTNGEEGINVLRYLRPDFVFLDINMPGLDGKMVLQRIRHDRTLDEIKICILSTSISPIENQLYRTMGADHCLQKPNSLDEFRQSLLLLLK